MRKGDSTAIDPLFLPFCRSRGYRSRLAKRRIQTASPNMAMAHCIVILMMMMIPMATCWRDLQAKPIDHGSLGNPNNSPPCPSSDPKNCLPQNQPAKKHTRPCNQGEAKSGSLGNPKNSPPCLSSDPKNCLPQNQPTNKHTRPYNQGEAKSIDYGSLGNPNNSPPCVSSDPKNCLPQNPPANKHKRPCNQGDRCRGGGS